MKASWDDEAAVWVAESDDVPGLATEAESIEALVGKLRHMVPELLELNGGDAARAAFPINLQAERVIKEAGSWPTSAES